MINRNYIIWGIIASSLIPLVGCANVAPRDRNYLAKSYMAADPDPLTSKYRDHADFSYEGTNGGYAGLSGGNCGCN